MSELMPCPFCGQHGAVHIVKYKGKDGFRNRYSVLCDYTDGGCGGCGGMYHSEVEAIVAWNMRDGCFREPRKPETRETNWAYKRLDCPSCGNVLSFQMPGSTPIDYNFCSKCGQPIDFDKTWEDYYENRRGNH